MKLTYGNELLDEPVNDPPPSDLRAACLLAAARFSGRALREIVAMLGAETKEIGDE